MVLFADGGIISGPINTAPVELTGAPSQPPGAAADQAEREEPVTIPLLAALAVAVLAAILAACVTLLITRRRRDRAPSPAAEVTGAEITPSVGKLHNQGARDGQQDSFSVSPEDLYPSHGLLAVVADGMGGLADGDRVSQEAVRSIMNRSFELPADMPSEQRMLELLYTANGAVNRLLGYERIGQCGSTLLLGWLCAGRFHYLSVGDSRICLMRGGALTQLNREHNYLRELEIRAVNGEGSFAEAHSHPRAGGLTSYLGMGQLKYVDIPDEPVEALPGDRFILMSDGVYNALTRSEMTLALSAADAQKAADALGAAIAGKNWPGQDNYTAVIIQC